MTTEDEWTDEQLNEALQALLEIVSAQQNLIERLEQRVETLEIDRIAKS